MRKLDFGKLLLQLLTRFAERSIVLMGKHIKRFADRP